MIIGHFIKYSHYPPDPNEKDHLGLLAVIPQFTPIGLEPSQSDKRWNYFIVQSDWKPSCKDGSIRLIKHDDPEHGPWFDIDITGDGQSWVDFQGSDYFVKHSVDIELMLANIDLPIAHRKVIHILSIANNLKHWAGVGYNQLIRLTGVSKKWLIEVIKDCHNRNMIELERHTGRGHKNFIKIQSDVSLWNVDKFYHRKGQPILDLLRELKGEVRLHPLKKEKDKERVKQDYTLSQIKGEATTTPLVGSYQVDTDPTIKNIKNKRKKECQTFSEGSDEIRLASLLFKKIQERDSHFKADLQKWATHIDQLIRIDHRTPEEIGRVIEWCQVDEFWKTNILSTEKLRKQFSTLWQKMPDNIRYKKQPGEAGDKDQATPARFRDRDGILWEMIKGEWKKVKDGS